LIDPRMPVWYFGVYHSVNWSVTVKLGAIDYLNCYPFYYHMLEKKPVKGVDIVPAIPSELNRMLKSGELDMSPVSSAVYTELQDEVTLLREFCLSSVGYVRSVVLISTMPIEYLNGKKVGLSTSSQTSVALLKILLQKYYGLQPEYVSSPPFPELDELDAALVIGNDAMLPMKQKIPYIYDLGDLWMRHTGHPVVFAVFALRNDSAVQWKGEINDVLASYRESLLCLDKERDDIILNAGRRYPILESDDLDIYYHLLKFNFTQGLKKALQFYYDEAAQLGLMPEVPGIRFAEL